MAKTRQRYTREYKVAAVKLVTEKGRSISRRLEALVSPPSCCGDGRSSSKPRVSKLSLVRATCHPLRKKSGSSRPRFNASRPNATF
jgi:hypothetical protein